MYKNFFLLLSLIAHFSHASCHYTSQPTEEYCNHAQQWVEELAKKLDPQEIQLVTNVVYLLYANALIDSKIHQLLIPINRLNQTIKRNVNNYKTTTDELTTLKTLIDRLSFVTGARTIFNAMLTTCIKHCNTTPCAYLEQSILTLELYGQRQINNYILENNTETNRILIESAEIIRSEIQPLDAITTFYKAVTDGSLKKAIERDESTKNIASVIVLEKLNNNNKIAIEHAEYLLNTLDNSAELISQLRSCSLEICKQHYIALYNHISSEDNDPLYAQTLFGMHDLLPNEYQSALPNPNTIFQHVLETVKLYTQIELIQ